MSNFNISSAHFDSNIFPNLDYQQVRLMSKEDVLDTVQASSNFSIRDALNSVPSINGIKKRKNFSPDREKVELNKLRKTSTTDELSLLSEDRVCDTLEKEVVKYGLENLSSVLDELINNRGMFSIITDKKVFNILLDLSSIPHILALLNMFDVEKGKNNTRLYIEAKERLEALKLSGSTNLKMGYLKIIEDIISEHKDKLLHTYANVDDYRKDMFAKISYKVCCFEYLFEQLLLNSINNIEIFNGIRNSNDYLLTIRINNTDKHCFLLLTNNGDNYTIKSSGLLSKEEYDDLARVAQVGDTWVKTNLSTNNFLFKQRNSEYIRKLIEDRNSSYRSFSNHDEVLSDKELLDIIRERTGDKNLVLSSKELDEIRGQFNTVISSNNRKRIREQFNELIIKNDAPIINEVYNLLLTNDINIIKKELPLILIKLYQCYTNGSKIISDEDYYKTLRILVSTLGTNKDIRELLDACYTNNIARINELIESDIDSCETETSVVIAKTDEGIYLDSLFSIKSSLLTFTSTSLDDNSFKKQLKSINKQFEEAYKKIQLIKINNIEDARRYIVLLNNYFESYSIVQSSIINLYSSFINKNTSIDTLIEFTIKYPNIFEYITNLGFDKAISDKTSLVTLANSEVDKNKEFKTIIDDISNHKNAYTYDQLFNILTNIDDSDSIRVIDTVCLKILASIITLLNNENVEQDNKVNIDKLNSLLELKKTYNNNKVLEKVG